MSDFAGKKARLVEKRARHVDNLKATTAAIEAIDLRIAECDAHLNAPAPTTQDAPAPEPE